MCLLITGNAQAIRAQLLDTKGLIDNIFDHNPDGLGFMYHTPAGTPVAQKFLPMNKGHAAHVTETVLKGHHGDMAIHFRWRTHGATNLEQCHPYPIGAPNNGRYLMHNGILQQTAHTADDHSDTWHFVRQYMSNTPDEALTDPQYLQMLGEFIGNNRFAILANGKLNVVNRHQGIEHEGVWYSNTYAWEPSILIPYYAPVFTRGCYGTGGMAHTTEIDLDDEYVCATLEAAYEAISDSDATSLANELARCPAEVIENTLYGYDITPAVLRDELPASYLEPVDAWVSYDQGRLVELATADPTTTAEALIYFCNIEAEE